MKKSLQTRIFIYSAISFSWLGALGMLQLETNQIELNNSNYMSSTIKTWGPKYANYTTQNKQHSVWNPRFINNEKLKSSAPLVSNQITENAHQLIRNIKQRSSTKEDNTLSLKENAIDNDIFKKVVTVPKQFKSTYNINELIEKGGLFFIKENAKLFSGKTIGYFSNGTKRGEFYIKKGLLHGTWIQWYENGNKELLRIYKEGQLNGKYFEWYEDGKKKYETIFKDNKNIGISRKWDKYGYQIKKNIIKIHPSQRAKLILRESILHRNPGK